MSDYSFQTECLNTMYNNTAGKIILPTGAGKSRIEFEYARSKMTRSDGKHQVVIVVAPRIILCQQLIQNFFDYLIDKYGDIKEKFTFVSSGHFPSGLKIGKQPFPGNNTTAIDQIKDDIEKGKQQGLDNILFSTYKSFSRCIEGVKAGIGEDSEVFLIADEAHYFTRKSSEDKNNSSFDALKNNLDMFKARFFFTATPRESGIEAESKSPMNNEPVYGKVIFERKPKDMMSAGIICEPRLHSVSFEEDISEKNFSTAAGDFILKAYDKHQEIVRSHCGDSQLKDKIGAKVLVAVEGSQQLNLLLNNGFKEKANAKGIKVFWTMSHQDIGSGSQEVLEDEEESVEKDMKIGSFLKDINECGKVDTNKMIILHYNQLTEGIDIPAMTGLIVLRGMVKEKAIQSIGRVLRVHTNDRDKDIKDKTDWIKPYSYIIVPNLETTSEFNELVKHLREEYSSVIKVEMTDSALGVTGQQPILQNFDDKKANYKIIDTKLVHEIEEFEKKLEEQIKQEQIDLF